MTIAKSHSGNFTQRQTGATYTITLTNNGTGPTNGSLVTVTDALPVGLTATSMAGSGWNCTPPGGSCSRSDVLTVGSSYPPITLTVNVSSSAPASGVNQASVTGGLSASGFINDTTLISPTTPTFSSNTTWTVPSSVTSITIQAYGAGGGSGGSDVDSDPGGTLVQNSYDAGAYDPPVGFDCSVPSPGPCTTTPRDSQLLTSPNFGRSWGAEPGFR